MPDRHPSVMPDRHPSVMPDLIGHLSYQNIYGKGSAGTLPEAKRTEEDYPIGY